MEYIKSKITLIAYIILIKIFILGASGKYISNKSVNIPKGSDLKFISIIDIMIIYIDNMYIIVLSVW